MSTCRTVASRSNTSASASASSCAAISRIGGDERAEVALLVPRLHRVPLHEPVRLGAAEPRLDEREQQPVREDEPVRGVEVPQHPLRIDDEAVDDPREAVEHVVEREERVRDHDPLGRRVRDVALVPERHVLEPDERRRAHDAREPRDPLGDLRVPLVRHRRRALHPGRERLLDLAHLGARQVPDLGREAVERRRDERERREQLRVPVARDHLRRDRIGLEPEPLARDPLDLGLDGRVRADRARELADAVDLERAQQARPVAVELERPAGELPAERRRLGVNPVRAADADRVPVLLRPPHDRVERALELGHDERARLADLQRERRVDDVRRGEAVVEPAPLRPELLRHRVDERRRVVVGDPLDLGDALGRRRHRAARESPRRPRPGSRRPRPTRRAPRARPRASAPACAPPTRQRPWPVASSGRSRRPV